MKTVKLSAVEEILKASVEEGDISENSYNNIISELHKGIGMSSISDINYEEKEEVRGILREVIYNG